MIVLNIELADLYFEGGNIVESFKSYEDALNSADLSNEKDLQDQIVEKLKAFRKKYPEIVEKNATFKLLPKNE
jgi:hypothetical protein